MEEAFEKLQKSGHNDVDNLVKWMHNSKIVDKDTEAKARELLKDADQANVDFKEFEGAVQKLAVEQNKSLGDFAKQLGEQSASIMGAMQAGVSAIKDAFK